MDAWEVLGVRPGATADEVRRAFAAAVRAVHPDAGGDHRQAADRLAGLVEARDRLLAPTLTSGAAGPPRTRLERVAIVLAHLVALGRAAAAKAREG